MPSTPAGPFLSGKEEHYRAMTCLHARMYLFLHEGLRAIKAGSVCYEELSEAISDHPCSLCLEHKTNLGEHDFDKLRLFESNFARYRT